MKAERSKPTLRILLGEAIAMGPGKAALLHAIERTGSISAAAREMEMSYRRAWLLVDAMNRCFREPLVETATGGPGGGGTFVTAFGQDILQRYHEMERKAAECVAPEMQAFSELMAHQAPAS
jgi:molybdate transport system regulatory protein